MSGEPRRVTFAGRPPYYGCDHPGDQSGDWVWGETYDAMKAERDRLARLVQGIENYLLGPIPPWDGGGWYAVESGGVELHFREFKDACEAYLEVQS